MSGYKKRRINSNQQLHAYIIGLALGDGNLSNPNKRAVRLRITCDTKYPELYLHIADSLQKLFPDNKVGIQKSPKGTYVNVYCYSNKLEDLLGWRCGYGSKYTQGVSIPKWVLEDRDMVKSCLRGLIQTDGSIYSDRGYSMVNFTTTISVLAETTVTAIQSLGYKPNVQIFESKHKTRYRFLNK